MYFLFFPLVVPLAVAATECDPASVTWNSSSENIYVRGEVTCTLTDLYAALPADAPLELVEPGVWWLGANLLLQQGATLSLVGSGAGGDVDELRLRSEHGGYVELTAMWGTLDIRETKITSWDEDRGGPDTDVDSGRAFVRALSYLDGDTPRVSRMDIHDSDVGWLGFYDAESYGLVWKVRGEEAPSLFEAVDVLGDVTGSRIHDNFFGVYTFGAYGMLFADNEVYGNHMYGIDPHDDSDALVVERNHIHDNGNHGFICSKRCDGLVVRDNVSERNAECGYMFHRGVTNSVFEDNVAADNADAGFAIMDSHDNLVRGNVAYGNNYGVRLSVGASGNTIEDNDLGGNLGYGINLYVGSDAPSINDGRPQANVFARNDVSGSGLYAVRSSGGAGNLYEDNDFSGSGLYAVDLVDSTDNVFAGNDVQGSGFAIEGPSANTLVDAGATWVSTSHRDASVTLVDTRGRVFSVPGAGPTLVREAGSELTFGPDATEEAVDVGTKNLGVVPQGGDVVVEVATWGWQRTFLTTPGTASAATFTVGGLRPMQVYTWTVDGVDVARVRADWSGRVVRVAAVGDAPHRFGLRPASAGPTKR